MSWKEGSNETLGGGWKKSWPECTEHGIPGFNVSEFTEDIARFPQLSGVEMDESDI